MNHHIVQFYDDDAYLTESVVRWLGDGLAAGEACFAICTLNHCEQFELAMTQRGFDLDRAAADGRWVMLDAHSVLSQCLRDGVPDAARFEQVMRAAIAPLQQRFASVRLFGEMVALLTERGEHGAAVRLEELWNALARSLRFSLLCAYPMRAFHEDAHCDVILEICAKHSQLIPAETGSNGHANDSRLRTIVHLQSRSKSLSGEPFNFS
jgi:hypothetical protein